MREPRTSKAMTGLRELPGHLFVILVSIIFIAPFVSMVAASLRESAQAGAGLGLSAYADLFGTFGEELRTSAVVTFSTVVINLLLTLPAAYVLARWRFAGRDVLLAVLNLALFVPPIVYGVALVITYPLLYGLFFGTLSGLIAAMVVGTYPLALIPILTSIRGLSEDLEQAASTLGADRWRAFRRVSLPLIAPGIAGGVLLTGVVVWNEFLVTMFVAGTNTTAPLILYNRISFYGIQPATAALAVFMQASSIVTIGAVVYLIMRRSSLVRGL